MNVQRMLVPSSQRGWFIVTGIVLAASAALLLRANRTPHLPYDVADGIYSSDCCGKIELRDGEMTANGRRWASYMVMEDERGPYLLPDAFVGTSDDGIELDGARPVRKLRLDRVPSPGRIDMPGSNGPNRFRREPPRLR